MTEMTPVSAGDRALSRRIAVLMRWGTLAASALLISGVALAWTGTQPASKIAITCGCGLLLLLPVLRLLLMLTRFGRSGDALYATTTALVIALIVGSAIIGVLL